MSDFSARMDELIAQVGDGELTGSVVVDQVYAKIQHERLDFKHPKGGQAKYLSGPLLNNHHGYMRTLADHVLGPPGSLPWAMVDVVEDLAGEVFDKAPRDFWDLRESAHPSVNDGQAVVYDRPAIVHRLSSGELKVKARLKAQGLSGGAPS